MLSIKKSRCLIVFLLPGAILQAFQQTYLARSILVKISIRDCITVIVCA